MAIAPGTRLGPYEITGPLGAGGMGEVYRARDTRLGRDVAVKVLPQHLSTSPDLRARFEREARAVSALNHPHICTLHDIGREGDTDYLVMELVEGETLAARLEKGPLPTEALLKTAIEVAGALDRAHRSGIIHRDLKPGNIMLTKGGAKLMDFGLARAAGPTAGPAGSALSQTPTVSHPLTAEGTIVGTFQYMAPEQIEGAEADARTDLFAFGAVLYEMATGKKAFAGRSQASLLAAILKEEPRAISEVQPMSPPALDRVVRRCLAKDPDERWQSARDVVHELEWIRDAGSQAGVPAQVAARRKSRERLGWITALAAVVLAAAGIVLAPRLLPRQRMAKVVRFSIAPPENLTLGGGNGTPSNSVISPDGRMLVFAPGDSAGTTRLWVRPMESLAAREIPGTEGAAYPFWSPDGRSIGFFADGKLKRVPVDGGRPQVLCDANSGRGGTWSREGVILFSPASQAPLSRVPASGGDVVQVTTLDTARKEIAHRWPRFLPDGRHFLYLTLPERDGQFDNFVGSLDGKPARLVARSDRAAVYAPPGYLLVVRNETLLAQRFDAASGATRGEPVSLGELPDAGGNLGEPNASVSDDGVLVWQSVVPVVAHLVWLDRSGKEVGTVTMTPGPYSGVTPSPDGRRAILLRPDPQTATDMWLVELDRGTTTRFTSEPGNEFFPVWSPDGSRLAFASNRNGPYDIYARPVTGSGQEEVLCRSGQLKKWPTTWSPDGRSIVFTGSSPKTGDDLWILPLDGDRKPVPYLNSRFNENNGAISPDGRWLAYTSDETGRNEVYVQPFPTPGAKSQVSTDGGDGARWSRDGRQLFFATVDGKIMGSDIQAGAEFQASVPRILFRLPHDFVDFGLSGERGLCLMPVGAQKPATLTVVQNWAAELKDK
jgi:Tol biopolymer transport system component